MYFAFFAVKNWKAAKDAKSAKGVVEGRRNWEGIPRRPKGGVADGDALAGVGTVKREKAHVPLWNMWVMTENRLIT